MDINELAARASVTYGDQDITAEQLASVAGFTHDEIGMLALFWDMAFNRSWILLTEEMVTSQFSNETTRYAYSHFVTRKLRSLPEGEMWREVERTHPLVQEYLISSVPNLAHPRNATTRQWFIISGDGYKTLLLSSNTERRCPSSMGER